VKAFLLAAGTGSRLRPITDHTPKCLLPIGGTPLLDLWLDALHRAEVDEVLVNLHYLPHLVLRHLQARSGPPAVRTAFEPELLAVPAPYVTTEIGCRTRSSSWRSMPTTSRTSTRTS